MTTSSTIEGMTTSSMIEGMTTSSTIESKLERPSPINIPKQVISIIVFDINYINDDLYG